MISSVLGGLLLGLALVFPFALGAASFAILQTSVQKGFYSGMQLAIGISLSDLMIMFGCFFGLQFIQNKTFQMGFGLVGGAVLLLYGIYILCKKKKDAVLPNTKDKKLYSKINWLGVFSEIGKGFVLNTFNPFLWLLWFSCISSGTVGKGKLEAVSFLLGIAAILFSVDLLKSFFANRITAFLSPKTIYIINKVTGVILIVCSAVLVVRTFYPNIFDF